MDAVLARFAERVRAAADRRSALRLRGGGTKDFLGGPLEGEVMETAEHAGIVSYEPSELVVTARCGTRLADLEDALAANRQILAFEPPRFAAGGTIGGCIASGLAGPRRAAVGLYHGAVRDFVLGCGLMDGRGDVLRFGGQVMKNVAGYDVSRLVAGSMGTLGILLDVSLKVLPAPVAGATLRFAIEERAALQQLNLWGGLPLPVTASAWHEGILSVRLEGAAAAVDAACSSLGGERLEPEPAGRFWQGLRDHAAPFFALPGVLWRLSVPSTAGPIALASGGNSTQLIEWGGALRWWKTDADAGAIRAAAKAAGGSATLFRDGDRLQATLSGQDPVLERLHRNVKAVFDPAGIFNRGRLGAQW